MSGSRFGQSEPSGESVALPEYGTKTVPVLHVAYVVGCGHDSTARKFTVSVIRCLIFPPGSVGYGVSSLPSS